MEVLDRHEFMKEILNPILTEMTVGVLGEMPNDPIPFMIKWLTARQGVTALEAEHQALRLQISKMEKSLLHVYHGVVVPKRREQLETSEDDKVDEFPFDIREPPSPRRRTKRRAVCAEAYGAWNRRPNIVPPIFSKTNEQKDRIRKALVLSVVFSTLEDYVLRTVIRAMKRRVVEIGERIVDEGEDGDFLFVVESGKLLWEHQTKTEKTLQSGDLFGELALLYNSARQATVTAVDKSIVWHIDRATFNLIVRDNMERKRERYSQFLKSVPLLKVLKDRELAQLADVLEEEEAEENATIVAQNHVGDTFYFIEEGTCVAIRQLSVKVEQYSSGDYFGELALLRNHPHPATVQATSKVKLLSLSRQSLKRLLGPLERIISRRLSHAEARSRNSSV